MDVQPARPRLQVTSRPYETRDDLSQMLTMLMDARSRSDDWRYPHVGELLFSFLMIACHLDPVAHIRLWRNGDRLVGYAILGEDPALDFQVLPGYEWCDIEDDAITWADELLGQLCRHDARAWGGPLVSGSRQDNERRIAFLEGHGFRPGGEFSEVNMICLLNSTLPRVVVPAGYQVRAVADESEIPNRAEAQRQVWQPWTVGNITNDDYATFMQLPGYERELDIVAVAPDGAMAAYVNGWIDPVNRIGDLGPVGALPAYRRQGLTRAALLECMRRMRLLGMDRVCVSTGVSNMPAIRLYESVGFRIVNHYLEYLRPKQEHHST